METFDEWIAGADAAARLMPLAPGDVLVREGDIADEVYCLKSGRLTAWIETSDGEAQLGSVESGELIGEVTVVVGGRRTATLRSEGDSVVACVSRPSFERFLARDADAADRVVESTRDRLDRSQVAAMVIEQLNTADPELVAAVVDRLEWRRLEAGEVLFTQGDPSDAAYFIVTGRLLVIVSKNVDGVHAMASGEDMVREIGRGEIVGELGIIDNSPRSATVRAIRDTTLAAFPAKVFEELAEQQPKLMLAVAQGLVGRMRRPPRRLADRAASITVAVFTDQRHDDLVPLFVDEVARHGSTIHLSSRHVDHLLDRDGIAQADDVQIPRLSEFLHETDVGHDHVVFETDREWSNWSRRVVLQSDRVVLVVSPDPDERECARIQTVVEALGNSPHVVRVLAVLHPPGTERPHGTAALMKRFGCGEVVHLRHGVPADVRRLARLSSGHGVGLVFSGGGARGYAHLGAYRALCESGVPIDSIAGCSMGAPMAGAVAVGIPLDDLEEVVRQHFHRLLDYTLPVVSMLKGRRITRSIEHRFGGWDIEDMWLPYYCVSTNLTTSRLEIHRQGDAAKFIRASVAIPGVLPPVPHEGSLLVDGAVLNNLPVSVMRMAGSIGTVIAVDVAPRRGPQAKSDFPVAISGWRALFSKKHRYPRVSAILLNSMLTGAVHNLREELKGDTVDLMLTVELPGVGMLEFDKVRPVAQFGYDHCKDTVAAWARQQSWLEESA